MTHATRYALVLMLALLGVFGCQDDVGSAPDMRTWSLQDDMDEVDAARHADSGDPQDTPQDMVEELLVDMLRADSGPVCPRLEVEACVTPQEILWDTTCEENLGVFFDGERCRLARGCACTGNQCPAFDSMEACMRSCGQEGRCREDVMPWGPYPVTSCLDVTCQEGVAVCHASEQDPTSMLNELFSDRVPFVCYPPQANSICEVELKLDCSKAWCCHGPPSDGVEQRTDLQSLCGLSLHDDVLGITCLNSD